MPAIRPLSAWISGCSRDHRPQQILAHVGRDELRQSCLDHHDRQQLGGAVMGSWMTAPRAGTWKAFATTPRQNPGSRWSLTPGGTKVSGMKGSIITHHHDVDGERPKLGELVALQVGEGKTSKCRIHHAR